MDEPLENIFRENLRFYRQNAKISQEKLSTLLDKNINYINMIESGKSLPPITMIEEISKILHVEPKCFFEPLAKNKEMCFDKERIISSVKNELDKTVEEILRKNL